VAAVLLSGAAQAAVIARQPAMAIHFVSLAKSAPPISLPPDPADEPRPPRIPAVTGSWLMRQSFQRGGICFTHHL
jgi:hypothetical protein